MVSQRTLDIDVFSCHGGNLATLRAKYGKTTGRGKKREIEREREGEGRKSGKKGGAI